MKHNYEEFIELILDMDIFGVDLDKDFRKLVLDNKDRRNLNLIRDYFFDRKLINDLRDILLNEEKFDTERITLILEKLVEIYPLSKNLLDAIIYKNNNREIEKKLLEWKLEKLKVILDKYLIKYTKLLNRNINYYQIKKLSSAWGIYHKKENYISFNSDLIEKDIECIEYVVLHELCHIFYMNHQKDFWALVEKYMPDYKVRRKNLKTFI